LLASLASVPVLAQSSDAARYVNAQGVEVIQARRAVKLEEANAAPERRLPVTAPRAAIAAGAARSTLKISAHEQYLRDEDRMAILQDELKKEAAEFETKVRLVQTPALKAKLSAEELARVETGLADHEKNLRSLNAEIGRMRLQP